MKIVPRPAQAMALKAALPALSGRQKRALVVLATGLGKTLAAAFITKKLRPKKTLFLAHSNFILNHAIGEFRKVFTESELSVSLYNGMSKNGAAEADMVFATWQTMGGKLDEWASDYFDLVIIDEAHHEGATTYRPVARYFTGPKLGITATYERGDDIDICDTFGEPVINITLEEAIARGWLPRIEYHVITDQSLDEKTLQLILGEIREGKKRFTMAEVDRRLFIQKREDDMAEIIDARPEKAIVFCRDIKHAERMSKMLSLSDTFHSKKGKGDKDNLKHNLAVLEALREGSIRRTCAVNAFNEGVDVPSVELVAFCRTTGSSIVFRQQLGRGLRPGKDKLVVLDFVGNLERIRSVRDMMNRIADLHEEFTSQDERNREGYVRRPFEVSGAGFEFTFSDEIVDLMEVLKHCEEDFYPTWKEASVAAIALGVKTVVAYKDNYKKDGKLPSDPYVVYLDFPGWGKFLKTGRRGSGRELYNKWQEASAAAVVLGITSNQIYNKRYKEDPKLPAAPQRIYLDFPGWGKFLKTGRSAKRYAKGRDLYPTWQEASVSAIDLGMKNKEQYQARYQEDLRLPQDPRHKYSNFPGWGVFLGKPTKEEFYSTWQEASVSVVKLQLKTRDEYRDGYRKDPKLPGSPPDFYPNFPGWGVFLGKPIKEEPYPTWQEASVAAIELGIKTQKQYRLEYKKDSRLAANVDRKYSNFPGWEKFLGKK